MIIAASPASTSYASTTTTKFYKNSEQSVLKLGVNEKEREKRTAQCTAGSHTNKINIYYVRHHTFILIISNVCWAGSPRELRAARCTAVPAHAGTNPDTIRKRFNL